MNYRKPTRINAEDWRELVKMHDGVFKCAYDNCVEKTRVIEPNDLAFDHIYARSRGEMPEDRRLLDALSNMQPMHHRCNSRKGVGLDDYWQRRFYFDNEFNVNAFNNAQRHQAFEKLYYHKGWFSRPTSMINGVLYTLAWVVGSGKTLSLAALGFGLNQIINERWGMGMPRIDRALVLTKEIAMRSQYAQDLQEDIVKYDICGIEPEVDELTHGGNLNPAWITQRDIVVACSQMFWENNGEPRISNINEVLSMFPLIIIDEPHWAHNQALKVVEHAHKSLVFGLTGTPIDRSGDLLNKTVLFSSWSYQEAVDKDQALKYISSFDHMVEDGSIKIIRTEKAELQYGKDLIEMSGDDTKSVSYYENSQPVKRSCITETINYLRECDRINANGGNRTALHRPALTIPNLQYPMHAKIVMDSIIHCVEMAEGTNNLFEGNRGHYPEEGGWNASVAHSQKEIKGNLRESTTITDGHAWMHAQNNNGQIGENASRLLFAVDMGVEGIHNQYCGCIVLVRSLDSISRTVQEIGRAIRGISEKNRDGIMIIPPRRLDTLQIITHDAYENEAAIRESINFLLNMNQALDGLMTVGDLVDGVDINNRAIIDSKARFPFKDQVRTIIDYIQSKETDPDFDFDTFVDEKGRSSSERKSRISKLLYTLESDPTLVEDAWFGNTSLPVFPVGMQEIPAENWTDTQLGQYIEAHKPGLVTVFKNYMQKDNPSDREDLRLLMVEMIRTERSVSQLPQFRRWTKLSEIRGQIGKSIESLLYNDLTQEALGKRMQYKLAGRAMRIIFKADNDTLSDGGEYDTPQHHHYLSDPAIRDKIERWIIKKLIRNSYCKTLSSAFAGTLEGVDWRYA